MLYTAENYERIIKYLEQQAQLIGQMEKEFGPFIDRLRLLDQKFEKINRQPILALRQDIVTQMRSPEMEQFLQKIHDLLDKHLAE